MSRNILITWLISALLYPLVLAIDLSNGFGQGQLDFGEFLIPLMILNLFFAFPSLLMGLLAGYLLQQWPGGFALRFIGWLGAAAGIVILNAGFLELLIKKEGVGFYQDLWWPAIITVVLVSVARINAFKKSFTDANKSEQDTDSTS